MLNDTAGQDSRGDSGTNVYAPNTLPTTVQYDRVLPSILLLLLFIKRHVLPVIRNQPLRRLAIQGPTNFLCPLHGLLYLLLGSSLFPPGTFLLLIPLTRLAILEAAHWIRLGSARALALLRHSLTACSTTSTYFSSSSSSFFALVFRTFYSRTLR